MAITNPLEPFLWGAGGQAMSPEQVARQREIANALFQGVGDTSPVDHWLQGVPRLTNALGYSLREGRADAAETAGMERGKTAFDPVIQALMGGSGVAPQTAAGATSAMAGGDFLSGLIDSESGGNWNALNNEGYGGRLQFGDARLADAAAAGIIPAGVTGAQFSRMSPEQQQAVEAWHFADIERQAQNMGLSQYYGQTIAGVPITPESVKAMAHLGGIGGVKKFVESGGQYNPADSNGTRLSDYGARFGGGSGAPQPIQVASLDPTIGAPAQAVPSAAFEYTPQGQPRDPDTGFVMSPDDPRYAEAMAGAGGQQLPPIASHSGVAQALMASPQTAQVPSGGSDLIPLLLAASSEPWARQQYGGIIDALMGSELQQRQQANDPLRQAQIAQAQQALRMGELEYNNALSPAAPGPVFEGGQWWDVSSGVPTALTDPAGGDNAREQQIARMMETGLDRNTAINIVDGRWRADTNPITGDMMIVDLATGQPVHQAETPGAPMSQINPALSQQFGTQFPASNEAFGVGGAAQGAINTALDAIGIGAPYPEVQQTQADFAVLQERLLNDISGSYGRQPPSWLLQRIDALTPKAGSPFEGAGAAQDKLQALGRDIQAELRIAEQRLTRQLTPSTREETETTIAGLQAALDRIGAALSSFGGGDESQDVGQPPEGVPPELWQVMTPEERALWQ